MSSHPLPRRFAAALLLSLGLAAFAAAPLPAQTPAKSSAKAGWTVHENREAHFAVSLPPSWSALEMDPAAIESSLTELGRQNAELGKAFGPQAKALLSAGFKFFAIDTSVDLAKVGFATNVNVLTEKLPMAMSLETNLEANMAQLDRLDSVRGLEKKIIEIDGKKAGRIEYRMMINPAAGLEVAISQVCFVVGQTSVIFTFTTLPNQSAHYAPVFEEMVSRLKILA